MNYTKEITLLGEEGLDFREISLRAKLSLVLLTIFLLLGFRGNYMTYLNNKEILKKEFNRSLGNSASSEPQLENFKLIPTEEKEAIMGMEIP